MINRRIWYLLVIDSILTVPRTTVTGCENWIGGQTWKRSAEKKGKKGFKMYAQLSLQGDVTTFLSSKTIRKK